MGIVGSKLRVALVWMTAVMLLAAGLPHVRCVCPDGHVKPFCLGSASPTSGCCCGGSCCGAAPGERTCCQSPPPTDPGATTQCCCCQAHARRPTKQAGPDAGRRLVGLACRKT